MNIFDELLSDIVGSTPIYVVMRKAKVLAYRLRNDDFKKWIENELNGYQDDDNLPTYRVLQTQAYGNFYNSAWKVTDSPIPVYCFPEEMQEYVNEIYIFQGLSEIEAVIDIINKSPDTEIAKFRWPAELLPLLTDKVRSGMYCGDAWRSVSKGQLIQIVDTVRNNLLSFVLELADIYPDAAESGFNSLDGISGKKVEQVFNYYIMGGSHSIVGSGSGTNQGGNMTFFDQRGQKVDYQYNAAGDINFNSVQNKVELIDVLEKLKAELGRAGQAQVIDAELVTDSQYQLTKAIQQAEKDQPNKQTVLTYLSGAKSVVEGVTSASVIVEGIAKAIELVQKLL